MSKDKKLRPELRFPEFKNDGEWQKKILEDVLDYERPDNYIVSDTNYQNEGIPVLTANKSFILGYTQEKFGIYNNLPAIIFDDFTVDSKYVDFPFKVKSSAIKILTPKKKDNLKFIYELISQIRFEAKEHKRYYISEYQKIELPFPLPNEQQKIASCLTSLDEVITAHSQKLELLKDHKKGLMQNLFPQEGEKLPKYRFKEFEKDGEWVEESLEYLTVKIGDGIHTTPKYEPSGEYYFVNGNNLIDGKIVVDEKTKRVSSEEFEIHKKDLTEKTIFLSINGTIGNLAFYNNEMVVLGKSACYITPNQKLNYVFLFYCLQSPRIIDYFFSEITGSTIKNLSLKSIRGTLINLPSEKEQQRIASCLSSLDGLVEAQAEKIEQLKLHKKGLMQGLFPKIND